MTSDNLDGLATETLEELSSWLYEQYLDGEDVLDDLHRIAEILRSRN